MDIFILTIEAFFPPISAFLGGIVTQEIIKAITQKIVPITQQYFFDCEELYSQHTDYNPDTYDYMSEWTKLKS